MNINKFSILINFIKFRYFLKFKSRKKLEKYQDKKIKKHIKFLINNSKYYSQFAKDEINLNDFPIVDKRIIMDNFDSINTVNVKKEDAFKVAIECEKSRNFTKKCSGLTVGLSSGTSGHRGLFLVSKKEQNLWVSNVLAKLLPKNKIFGHRVAFFLRADSNLYENANNFFIKFRYFDIYKSLDTYINELNGFSPTLLVAPSSVLLELSNFIFENKLRIYPEKIISIAEVLESKDEGKIKKAFKKDIIHQVYQCTEGFLGYTCRCGNLHFNEDIVKLEKEYVGKNRFVPIITDFFRTSQPIIRYRLNDVIIEDNNSCKCGSKCLRIKAIEGREDDIFIFKSRNGKEVNVFSDFIRRCFLFSCSIIQYRAVQVKCDLVKIFIESKNFDLAKDEVLREFKKLSDELDFEMPKFEFEKYFFDKSKKLKRVERIFKGDIYEKC